MFSVGPMGIPMERTYGCILIYICPFELTVHGQNVVVLNHCCALDKVMM